MERYVALLRGINVGGSNLIRMPALVESFEALGFEDVATYIQSGNVLFRTDRAAGPRLTGRIERALSAEYGFPVRVVVRSRPQLEVVVARAPKGFGSRPAQYRYDVLFLREPLTAEEVMESVRTREGVDEAHAGEAVLYFSRLIRRASQSYLTRIVGTPVYQRMTIRNWNTTTRLLRMLQA